MPLTPANVTTENEHEKIWNLLPWYVNHSLDSVEQELVKNHIRNCITCRIELQQQRQLFDKMQQIEPLQQVSQISFAKLKKQIKTTPEPAVLAEHKRLEKLSTASFHRYSGATKYVALAASVLLLASPLMFTVQMEMLDMSESQAEYRTLADANTDVPRNIARIAFVEEQLKPQQIEAILHDVSGRIVKGPFSNGIYEIQIGNHETSQEMLSDTILRLRNNSLVIFAEFVQG